MIDKLKELSPKINIVITTGTKTSKDIGTKDTDNAEAFRLYTQGRELWMTRSQAGMKQSIKLYKQAVKLDDNFALAFSGIADAYSMLAVYGFMNPDEAYPEARKFVLDAISRNSNLSEAYTSLGWIQFAYEGKLKDSEKSYRKGIELNSKITQAHQWLGINLQAQGRYEEAYSTLKQGLELDPNHHVLLSNLTDTCCSLGEFDESEAHAKKALFINPLFYNSWYGLYKTYILAGADPDKIKGLVEEIEGIVDKNIGIYNVLIHYYNKEDSHKSDLYLRLANELDKLSGNRYLQNRVILEVGFDEFMKLAAGALNNNTLDYAFETDIFMVEHREHPKFKSFIKKIREDK